MGILKDVLNILKKLSEGLFNYLGGADGDSSKISIDEKKVKKINESTFELPCKYKGTHAELPYTVKLKLKDDNLADIEVIYSEGNDTKYARRSNVSSEDYLKLSEKLLVSLLDNDTKQAFGIHAAKTLQVTLQRITAAKETSINLTAIKANYELSEAYDDLDSILDVPEFTEAITEEPISFEIIDIGDDYDISTIDSITDNTIYSLRNLLCAAVQFQMDIQLLHWECARNESLFHKVGSQMYGAMDWVDKLGLWVIETSNSVCNVLGDCIPDLGETVDVSLDHSPCIDYTGQQVIFPVFDRMIEAIENNLPNLPSDMQLQLNYGLRDLKQMRDFDLKQV